MPLRFIFSKSISRSFPFLGLLLCKPDLCAIDVLSPILFRSRRIPFRFLFVVLLYTTSLPSSYHCLSCSLSGVVSWMLAISCSSNTFLKTFSFRCLCSTDLYLSLQRPYGTLHFNSFLLSSSGVHVRALPTLCSICSINSTCIS